MIHPPQKNNLPPKLRTTIFIPKGRLFGVPVSDYISDWWVAIYRLVDQEIAPWIWWEAKKCTTTRGTGRDVLLVEWHREVTVHWKTRVLFFFHNNNFPWASQRERCLLIEGFFSFVFYRFFFLSSLNVLRSIPRVPGATIKEPQKWLNFRISMTSSWILDTKLFWYLYIFTNIKEWCKTSCLYMYIYIYMSYYQYHICIHVVNLNMYMSYIFQ